MDEHLSDVVRAGSGAARSAAGRSRRGWSDLPLRAKVACVMPAVVVWSVVGGYGIARLPEPHATYAVVPVAVVLAGVAIAVAVRWIAQPVEQLAAQAKRMTMADRPLSAGSLPRERADEVGQLARSLHRLAIAAQNDRREAVSLRRTLDDRVARATRSATAELSQLAMRDPLTGVGNRRFLDAYLPPLVDSCRQSGTDLACVVFDVDGFKPINDTVGHAAGDALLRATGTLLKAVVRPDDMVGRLGGDEFVMFIPGADAGRATDIAGQARRLFRDQASVLVGQAPQPDLSFGVATLRADGASDADALMRLADERLYAARGEGRR